MKIRACMKCGSRNLQTPTLEDGRIPGRIGSFDERLCNDCRHLGVPIIFDNEQAYEEFKKTRQ